jgi:hypothetical protein
MQQEEPAMGSTAAGPRVTRTREHKIEQEVYQRVGYHPHKGKRRCRAESSAQGVQRTQEELAIVMPKIPKGVKTDDNMVGGVDSLKYSDHDVSDAIKFPDLAAQSYLESRGEGPSGAPLLEPAQWILGLYNTDIMNLLDIPHFGHGKHINGCVKQLVSRVHGGILWMDRPVPINVDLIKQLQGYPQMGRSQNNT